MLFRSVVSGTKEDNEEVAMAPCPDDDVEKVDNPRLVKLAQAKKSKPALSGNTRAKMREVAEGIKSMGLDSATTSRLLERFIEAVAQDVTGRRPTRTGGTQTIVQTSNGGTQTIVQTSSGGTQTTVQTSNVGVSPVFHLPKAQPVQAAVQAAVQSNEIQPGDVVIAAPRGLQVSPIKSFTPGVGAIHIMTPRGVGSHDTPGVAFVQVME